MRCQPYQILDHNYLVARRARPEKKEPAPTDEIRRPQTQFMNQYEPRPGLERREKDL